MERWAAIIEDGPPDRVHFDAFKDGALVGRTTVSHKTRHRAGISAMYVAGEARGSGAGRTLLDAAVAYARSLEGVEDVVLAVTALLPAVTASYTEPPVL